MTKTERLRSAYQDLKFGKIIEFIPDEGKHKTKCGCRCWISKGNFDKRRYISWSYFGSSAKRMSLHDLRWIAKNIGDCTTYEYKIVNSVYGD